MKVFVQERFQISPYMAAYVVVALQIGVGALGFQRIIAKDAGYDGWISVICAGLLTHIFVWMMYKICEMVEGDIIFANVYMFGKIIGNTITTLFIVYFLITCVTVLGELIEVIRTWMFLDISPLAFATIYLLLGIYIVFGGFRTVAGMAFFGKIIPAYLIFSFGYALKYADFTNFLPIIDHGLVDMAKGTYDMSLSFLGFEVLLVIYPFIKKPEQSKKWVHIGLLSTTIVYLILAIITFAYFPPGLLDRSIWPTLEMWKIVRLPFVERWEYLGIANWTLLILPNVAISLWAASRCVKRVYHLSQRKAVLILALFCLIIVVQIPTRPRMELFLGYDSKVGLVLVYGYIPILYLSLLIKKKVKAR